MALSQFFRRNKKQSISPIREAIILGDKHAPANHVVSVAWDRVNCEWNAWYIHKQSQRSLGPITGRSRSGPVEAVRDLMLELNHWQSYSNLMQNGAYRGQGNHC